MTNQELLNKLYELGKLPSDRDSASDDFPFDEFDKLLQQFTTPVTEEEAIKLINLSPPVDTGCYGVEWTLLHLIETVGINRLRYVLDNAEDGEIKWLIHARLESYNKNKE
ncbi:MAG: hypothetical protein LBG19_08705 [Prevotellaceae bacterium]|jgi:hypothetical protein|nr:hypothetical protein [Prevotellaceae bacterium]